LQGLSLLRAWLRALSSNRRWWHDFADFYFLTFRTIASSTPDVSAAISVENLCPVSRVKSASTGIDEIAGFLVPDGNDSARDRFTDSWNFTSMLNRA